MECAVTGQTVVSGHYVRFLPKREYEITEEMDREARNGAARAAGEIARAGARHYALPSPPAEPGGLFAGTVQTLAASLEQVCEDISRAGVAGTLLWNPKYMQAPDGSAQQFFTLKPWSLDIEPGSPDQIRAQILKGGKVRLRFPATTPWGGVLNVDADVIAVPPFAGI